MNGRDFLVLANEDVAVADEIHWRGATIHAYYAGVLECREALARWGVAVPRHQSMHAFVRTRLQYATDPDLKYLGNELEWLGRRRNAASYDLPAAPYFTRDVVAREAIRRATALLTLLDTLEADPVRRAAAIASLPP